MSETTLQWISFLKIICVAVFALLYGLGGMRGKWNRRIVGSGFLTLCVIGFSLWQKSFSAWYLLYWPLLWGALSIGYGAEKPSKKIVKRLRYGLACGFASIPLAVVNEAWIMFGFHLSLCLFVSTVLGSLNPIEAREEETAIGAFIAFLPLFMI